jgi:hypothetical protein
MPQRNGEPTFSRDYFFSLMRPLLLLRDVGKKLSEMHDTVNGRWKGQEEFMSLFGAAGEARDEFHLAARSSLSVRSEFLRSVKFENYGRGIGQDTGRR